MITLLRLDLQTISVDTYTVKDETCAVELCLPSGFDGPELCLSRKSNSLKFVSPAITYNRGAELGFTGSSFVIWHWFQIRNTQYVAIIS